MPLNRAQRRHATATTTVIVDAGLPEESRMEIKYRPGRLTPKAIADMQEVDDDIIAISRAVCDFVVAWDMTDIVQRPVLDANGEPVLDTAGEPVTEDVVDEQGQPVTYAVPVTVEEASRTDLRTLNAIVKACVSATQPGEANAGSFAAS
jgi:hypothetical protein